LIIYCRWIDITFYIYLTTKTKQQVKRNTLYLVGTTISPNLSN